MDIPGRATNEVLIIAEDEAFPAFEPGAELLMGLPLKRKRNESTD
jgi:hypothetical protein